MQRSVLVRVFLAVMVSSLVLSLPVMLPGCGGGDDKPTIVAPKEAPIVSAKASMNEYLQSKNKTKGAQGASK